MPGGTLTAKHSAARFHTRCKLQKKIWKGANWSSLTIRWTAKRIFQPRRLASRGLDREVHLFRFLVQYEDLNIFEGEDATKSDGTVNKDVAEVFLNPQPSAFGIITNSKSPE